VTILDALTMRLWPGRCQVCGQKAVARYRLWDGDHMTVDARACDEHADEVRKLVQELGVQSYLIRNRDLHGEH
jgi:hypothetical protein